jgi:hypothetical protein
MGLTMNKTANCKRWGRIQQLLVAFKKRPKSIVKKYTTIGDSPARIEPKSFPVFNVLGKK